MTQTEERAPSGEAPELREEPSVVALADGPDRPVEAPETIVSGVATARPGAVDTATAAMEHEVLVAVGLVRAFDAAMGASAAVFKSVGLCVNSERRAGHNCRDR